MGTVRPTQPFSFPVPTVTGAEVVKVAQADMVRPACLSPDRTTAYGWRSQYDLMLSRDDGATWTRFHATPGNDGSIRGFWVGPDGEAFYSTESAGVGQSALFKSTGFETDPASATWRRVLSVSQKANLQIHGGWGFSWAPKGHPREGLMVATEYGGQGNTSRDTPDMIGRAWRSWDYGDTWETIFVLGEQIGVQQQHMHAIAYDPWADTIIVSFGDGNGSAGSVSQVLYTEDVTAAREDMQWRTIVDSGSSATYQVTTLHPHEQCIVVGGDGSPCGVYRIPRRGPRGYGAIEQGIVYRGGTDTGWISQRFYRHGDGPVFLSKQYIKTADEPCSIDVYHDGVFAELWRDNDRKGLADRPNMNAIGVTAGGWVLGNFQHETRGNNSEMNYYQFRAKYQEA